MSKLNLQIISGRFVVSQFVLLSSLPPLDNLGEIWSLTKTNEEISLVCGEKYIQPGWKSEPGWKVIKIVGPLEFSLTGILESILQPLAKARISIFAISTYDTDYIMVKQEKIEAVIKVLEQNNFKFN